MQVQSPFPGMVQSVEGIVHADVLATEKQIHYLIFYRRELSFPQLCDAMIAELRTAKETFERGAGQNF
jgi:hypothetical protein